MLLPLSRIGGLVRDADADSDAPKKSLPAFEMWLGPMIPAMRRRLCPNSRNIRASSLALATLLSRSNIYGKRAFCTEPC